MHRDKLSNSLAFLNWLNFLFAEGMKLGCSSLAAFSTPRREDRRVSMREEFEVGERDRVSTALGSSRF